MKRLLRQKANFGILEGFFSELLHRDVLIQEILESEGNKSDEDDKFNRVDILAKIDRGAERPRARLLPPNELRSGQARDRIHWYRQ